MGKVISRLFSVFRSCRRLEFIFFPFQSRFFVSLSGGRGLMMMGFMFHSFNY
jgi:hypothetical protein